MVGPPAWYRDPEGYRQQLPMWDHIEQDEARVASGSNQPITCVEPRDRLCLVDVIINQLITEEILGPTPASPQGHHSRASRSQLPLRRSDRVIGERVG